MSSDRPALHLVADVLEIHHDHVWARLPFLGPMAARLDRHRLSALIVTLRDLLFSHLDREDRVLISIANDEQSPELARRSARLRAEHETVTELLGLIQTEMDAAPDHDGPTERTLRAELQDLGEHLRAQILIEDTLLAPVQSSPDRGVATRSRNS